MHAGRIMDAVTPIDQMFSEYAAVQVPAELERMIYNGNRFPAPLLKRKLHRQEHKAGIEYMTLKSISVEFMNTG